MGGITNKSTINKQDHHVHWFEIPVLNLNRAVSFYNHIYSTNMQVVEQAEYAMAIFPSKTANGGALVMGQGCQPSENGVLVYLNAGKDLNNVLSKIEAAGGRVILEKTFISSDAGYFALFIDSEGNKLALHSNN